MSNATDVVALDIDGTPTEVAKGTLIIRAAEELGIHIPRFCDHPLLKPAGACRQCLVEVAMPDREGNVRAMPKPQAACTMTVTPGMQVSTQRTSPVAKKAQEGIMEFLLINHPLDCPVCDKGGECPLQNQAVSHGGSGTRFTEAKRTYPKPVTLSSTIMLDRDRCILCQRCTRFSKEIAGDVFIDLQGRGGGSSPVDHHQHMGEQIGTFDTQVLGVVGPDNIHGDAFSFDEEYAGPRGNAGIVGSTHPGTIGCDETDASGRPFASYFSGNTIQICPVGALTSATYRFRGRPFDLLSTDGITEHDASGAKIRTDVRRGEVVRRMAGRDMDVNEEWITDKDRFAYKWQFGDDRIHMPLVREDGVLVETSWSDALDRAAQGLLAAKENGGVGLLPGGRLTFEDAYAWSKFARVVLETNDIDQRNRCASEEELNFLASQVAGTGLGVTYGDIEKAGTVLLVGIEPEDECGTLFLRLRKGVLAKTVAVSTVAAFTSRGSQKMSANVIKAAPGTEPEILAGIIEASTVSGLAELATALQEPNAVIVVGERAAATPGLLSAVVDLAERTMSRIAWVPRRAGERGGLEAGLLPNLLPFGRPVTDGESRADVTAVWGKDVPGKNGKDALGIVNAATSGALGGLVVGGVDPRDLPGADIRSAVEKVGFVVSLEVRQSDITKLADVVLPVAPPAEKPGTFVNWEGRLRPFGQVLTSRSMPDREILHRLAAELNVDLGLKTLKQLHLEANELMDWDGSRSSMHTVEAPKPSKQAAGKAVLATHKLMLDEGCLQEGQPNLTETARTSVVRLSATTAATVGVTEGKSLTVSTTKGKIVLPLVIADLPDGVVWLPQCSPDSAVIETLGVTSGDIVTISGSKEVAK